jgi:hypothetical protein
VPIELESAQRPESHRAGGLRPDPLRPDSAPACERQIARAG